MPTPDTLLEHLLRQHQYKRFARLLVESIADEYDRLTPAQRERQKVIQKVKQLF